jgi:hypothetical protein
MIGPLMRTLPPIRETAAVSAGCSAPTSPFVSKYFRREPDGNALGYGPRLPDQWGGNGIAEAASDRKDAQRAGSSYAEYAEAG